MAREIFSTCSDPVRLCLIGRLFFGFLFGSVPTGRLVVFRKEPQDRQKQTFILNFIPLRTYFEDEAVISTPSAIQQWLALVKPEFDHQIPEFDHKYLILTTRSTEILVPKQDYRVRKSAEYICPLSPPPPDPTRTL
jgi:hypothetical protein